MKTEILDQLCELSGWSRGHARRRLLAKASAPPSRGALHVRAPAKRGRGRKYSYRALKVLQRVWALTGGPCGKYLAASMPVVLDNLEYHGHVVVGEDSYGPEMRGELEAMSAATIDRYLAPVKKADPIRGRSTTSPGSVLKTQITVRRAGDEVEQEPGFFEADTVAHCGPTARGEFCYSVNLTDVFTGWVFTRSIPNGAHRRVLDVLDLAVDAIPYPLVGLDVDNGSEFINWDAIDWVHVRHILFTRSRPYKKNDQATIESKNNHLVRRYGFYYRYDTPEELEVLNRLWPLVNTRLNLFTPTKKPVGWTQDRAGRRRRVYDAPATPLDRLIKSGILTPEQHQSLLDQRRSADLASITLTIDRLQRRLLELSAEKTRLLQDKLAINASRDAFVTGRQPKNR